MEMEKPKHNTVKVDGEQFEFLRELAGKRMIKFKRFISMQELIREAVALLQQNVRGK